MRLSEKRRQCGYCGRVEEEGDGGAGIAVRPPSSASRLKYMSQLLKTLRKIALHSSATASQLRHDALMPELEG